MRTICSQCSFVMVSSHFYYEAHIVILTFELTELKTPNQTFLETTIKQTFPVTTMWERVSSINREQVLVIITFQYLKKNTHQYTCQMHLPE